MTSGLFSDLTIVCNDRKFHVHKSILWIQSEYFRKLLGGKFKVRCLTHRSIIIATSFDPSA